MAKKIKKQAIDSVAYVNVNGEIVMLKEFNPEGAGMVEHNITLSPSSCIGVYAADCETYRNNVVGVNKTAVWSLATTAVTPPYSYTDVNTITDVNDTDCIGEWLNYILSRRGADYLIKLQEDKDYTIIDVDENVVYVTFKTVPDYMLKHIYMYKNDIYLNLNVVTVYFHNLDFDGSFIGAYLEVNAEKLGLTKEYTVTPEFYMKQNAYNILYHKEATNFIYIAVKGVENTVLFIKDSANLVSGSLKEVANAFDTQYKKLDMDYDEHKPGEELTEEMKKYIANDVLALAEIVHKLLSNGMTQLTASGFAFQKLKDKIGQSKFSNHFPNQYSEWLLKDEKGYILPLKEDGLLDVGKLLENIGTMQTVVKTADDIVRESYRGGLVLLRDNKIKQRVEDADIYEQSEQTDDEIYEQSKPTDNDVRVHSEQTDDVYVQSDITEGVGEVRTGRGVALDCTSMYPYILHSKSGTYFPVKRPIYVYSKDEINYSYEDLYEILGDGVKIVEKCDIIRYISNAKYFRSFVALLKRLDWGSPDTAIEFLIKNMGCVSTAVVDFDYDVKSVYRFIKFKCSFRLKDDGIPCVVVPSIGSQATSFLRCNKTVSSLGEVVELTLSQVDFMLFVENYNICDFEALQMIEYEAEIGLFDKFVDIYFEAKQNSKGVHRALNKSILNNCTGRMGRKKSTGVAVPCIDEKGRLSFKIVEDIKTEETYAYVPVASALLSAARRYVIYGIKNIFPTTFNYTDTDSLKVEESLESVKKKIANDKLYTLGNSLGEWKNDLGDDVEFDKATYIKLKTYACKVGNDYHITAAGISKRATSIAEKYFSLSGDYINIYNNEKDCVAKIKNEIRQLNLSDVEFDWIYEQLCDDVQLKKDNYNGDIPIGFEKFQLGYKLPQQLQARRVANGVILEYVQHEL